MTVTICIGSSCHIKGSREIIDKLNEIIALNRLNDKAQLAGSVCMDNCKQGVCVRVDEKLFSLKPEDVSSFFENEILGKVK